MSNAEEKTNLAIVGSGPGGYVAALRAAALGANVTLIENDLLGGTCLNRGCIPSKALLHSAQIFDYVRRAAEFGVITDTPKADLPAMVQRMDKVVAQLRKGVELLLEARGVNVIKAAGRLLAPGRISARNAEGEETTLSADKIILATGSLPARPPIPGADSEGVVTSNEILFLSEIPASLVIIGAGAIGLEFAYLFAVLGSKVTLIEMLPRILPTEDEELTVELARSFRRLGVTTYTNAKVLEIASNNGDKQVKFVHKDKETLAQGALVLLATGRVPNAQNLGLENINLEMDNRTIKVNSYMETSQPGIYAIGDLVAGPQLAHKASAEGKVAAHNALGENLEMDYRAIPTCTYTHPEIASVGLNESQAGEQGVAVKIGRFPFRALGKAVALGERAGFVKLVAEASSGRLLGAQMVGPHVTDIVSEITLAVKEGIPADKLAEVIHPHPTLSEPLQEAAEDIFGLAIHKP